MSGSPPMPECVNWSQVAPNTYFVPQQLNCIEVSQSESRELRLVVGSMSTAPVGRGREWCQQLLEAAPARERVAGPGANQHST